MNSDADRLWNDLAAKYRHRNGLTPMTPDAADAAYDDSPAIPLSTDQIRSIVESATSDEPLTWEPPNIEWQESAETEEAEHGMLALYREQGETDPESDEAEDELRRKMLSDDSEDKDGLDGDETLPGRGR